MSKKSAPASPDPKETAAAQTGTNLATAQANAVLGNVNQVTPYGNLTYTTTGQQFVSDANGQTYYKAPDGTYSTTKPGMVAQYATTPAATATSAAMSGDRSNGSNSLGNLFANRSAKQTITGYSLPKGYEEVKGYYVPQYTATQTLSKPQQAILDQTQGAQLNLAKTANERSDWLSEYLKKPLTLESANATREQAQDALMKRLQPSLDAQDQANQTMLNNQGVRAGSVAYDRSRDEVNRNAVDARLAAILASGQEAQNQYALESAARSAPINEIIGLMSGSQVQQPQYANSNMPTIPTTDYASLVQQDYQNRLASWQQQQATTGGIIGGIAKLGASFLPSDERLKTDIRRIGQTDDGLPIYTYYYVWGGPIQVGVLAQEVEAIKPEAVTTMPSGFKAVDYSKIGGCHA